MSMQAIRLDYTHHVIRSFLGGFKPLTLVKFIQLIGEVTRA